MIATRAGQGLGLADSPDRRGRAAGLAQSLAKIIQAALGDDRFGPPTGDGKGIAVFGDSLGGPAELLQARAPLVERAAEGFSAAVVPCELLDVTQGIEGSVEGQRSPA